MRSMNFGVKNQFVLIVILTVFLLVTYFVSINLRESYNLPLKISEFISWQSFIVISEEPPVGRENVLNTSVEKVPEFQNFSRVFHRFNVRKQFLEKRCRLANITESYVNYDYFLNERMLYEKHHGFVVCLVAKNAASTWRQHMEDVGLKQNEGSSEELSKKEKEKIVLSADIVKVLTVRYPIDRLVSAYRDKFGDGSEATNLENTKQWYDFAAQTLHKPLGDHQNRSISFDKYINVVTKDPAKRDRHFRSVYSNCVPCKIDYDFIVHQETFSEDLSYLFLALNITESSIDVHINESRNKTSGRKPSELYLKELNSEQLVAIYDLLWIDFFLFDYPLPNYIYDALKEYGRDLLS